MSTKDTNYKSVLKSNIILFLSYSILIGFIFILLTFIIKCTLHEISNLSLSITLSLISGIIVFYLLRFVCRSSTLESFRKIQLSQENEKQFIQKMNVFFMICLLLSVLISIGYLVMNHLLFLHTIAESYEKYEFISFEFATQLVNNISQEYHHSLFSRISSTIIIELALVISFFSLVPYQKKLLSKYNET